MSLSLFTNTVFQELTATRYMSAAGLMILFYDHVLTFADEVELIWPAPSTYAKYIFLLNRYTVLGTLIAVAYESCGFVDTTFTDLFFFTCSMIAIVSIGIANLLILQRVVILWEHRPIVLKVMTVGFLISFIAQVATMIPTLISLLSTISWSSIAGMCITTKATPVLAAVWACPMLFELFVLGSTALNALDRPRTTELPIIKALHSDGLPFFLGISCCRLINLVLAAANRPGLTFLAVFFIWAMTTTILGRLLLRLRRAECRPPPVLDPTSEEYDPTLNGEQSPNGRTSSAGWSETRRTSRAISPFGLVPLNKVVSSGSMDRESYHDRLSPEGGYGPRHSRALSLAGDRPMEVPIEAPVQMGMLYHYRKKTYDPYVRPWD